jgi:hypothetical protein
LLYCCVIEQPDDDFNNVLDLENKGKLYKQTTKLIVSRGMLSVVNTIYNLYEFGELVLNAITPDDFRTRDDNQSGFL